jgi:rubredoxin
MSEPLDRRCPACQTGTGLARTVSTIPGRPSTVTVRMVCGSCQHEWTTEHSDPLVTLVEKAS